MTPGDQVSPLTFRPQPLKRNTFNISTFVSPGPTSDSHLAQVPEGCACRLEFALVQKQNGFVSPRRLSSNSSDTQAGGQEIAEVRGQPQPVF